MTKEFILYVFTGCMCICSALTIMEYLRGNEKKSNAFLVLAVTSGAVAICAVLLPSTFNIKGYEMQVRYLEYRISHLQENGIKQETYKSRCREKIIRLQTEIDRLSVITHKGTD